MWRSRIASLDCNQACSLRSSCSQEWRLSEVESPVSSVSSASGFGTNAFHAIRTGRRTASKFVPRVPLKAQGPLLRKEIRSGLSASVPLFTCSGRGNEERNTRPHSDSAGDVEPMEVHDWTGDPLARTSRRTSLGTENPRPFTEREEMNRCVEKTVSPFSRPRLQKRAGSPRRAETQRSQ